MLSEKQISRLSHYRRLLKTMEAQGLVFIFSHQLASMAHVTAAQVRRVTVQRAAGDRGEAVLP